MRNFLATLTLVVASVAQGADTFQLSSPDIRPGKPLSLAQVYNGSGCKGANRSPALNWKGAPKGTKSYAVTMYDPDAPSGGWWHWILIDIPAKATGLAPDAGNSDRPTAPAGSSHRRNSSGIRAYGGACPPPGAPAHHYHITLYALDVARLDLPGDASPARVKRVLNQHALGKSEIVARYGR